MKEKIYILCTVAALFLYGCATSQQRAEQKALTQQMVTEAVAKRQWHIDITTMNTLRYGTRTVAADFFLELRGDTLRSYLPYLGQAHRAPLMGVSQGLNFEAPLLNYQEKAAKHDCRQIDLDVKTQEDQYHYTIEVFTTGKASIRVNSIHRDPISFDGDLTDLPPVP
jgi:hypothetical protein